MLSIKYRAGDFFMARSPLLPFDTLAGWQGGSVPAADTKREHAAHRAVLLDRLAALFERREVKEALFLASPELEGRVDAWLVGKAPDAALVRVLTAYFTRLASRQTPFGTFAGVSLGNIGEHTRIEIGPLSTYAAHARLGMGFVVRALGAIEQSALDTGHVHYAPNGTLEEVFGRLRFSRFDIEEHSGQAASYPAVEIEKTPDLMAALARAAHGAALRDIAAAVAEVTGDSGQALAFARELVEHDVLEPRWRPAVSGPEPFAAICREVAEQLGSSHEAETLRAACDQLALASDAAPGSLIDRLRLLRQTLLPDGNGTELAQLFQVDLVKPAPELSLGPGCVDLCVLAASVIQRTNPPDRDPRLARFAERFVGRYESRLVPLAEALDPDLGVGFDAFQGMARDEWVETLVGRRAGPPAASAGFGACDAARLELLSHCLEHGASTCDLAQGWLERFPEREMGELPESFAVMAQVATLEGRVSVVAPRVVAPSAASVMARFCHADPELERAVRRLVEREQTLAGPCILADVAHFPSGHVANVLLRPVLRAFEIPCGGKSGAPGEQQIPLSDLSVGVEAGRPYLYFHRLGRRVSIRITNAHNTNAWRNLPLYRFLGALQDADASALGLCWSWGPLGNSAFLPRVTYGDVVLSLASWRLGSDVVKPLLAAPAPEAFQRLRELRRERGLPRWVSPQGNPLVVDLDNCLSVEMLVHELGADPSLRLEEVLPGPGEHLLHGPEGAFACELVVPFVLKEPARRAVDVAGRSPRRSPAVQPALRRSFLPGSEWLYVKIYTGPSQLDELLERLVREVIAPQPVGVIDRWFFLAYADPDPHLRVRMHGEPSALTGHVLPMLERALASERQRGSVWKLQVDTYERELERYGGAGCIELAEQAFHVDSEAALALIQACGDDTELRWKLALVGIDRLLGDFGLDLERRFALTELLLEGYRQEHSLSAVRRKAIGADYRLRAGRLARLLWSRPSEHTPAERRGLQAIERRSARLTPLAARLSVAALLANASYLPIVSSLVHMHVVRMLGLNVRSYELVLYDYLRRQYATRRALAARSDGSPGEARS
jgi:thiopeptide-type bacteriocin biosynthesis protein